MKYKQLLQEIYQFAEDNRGRFPDRIKIRVDIHRLISSEIDSTRPDLLRVKRVRDPLFQDRFEGVPVTVVENSWDDIIPEWVMEVDL